VHEGAGDNEEKTVDDELEYAERGDHPHDGAERRHHRPFELEREVDCGTRDREHAEHDLEQALCEQHGRDRNLPFIADYDGGVRSVSLG
jgi:hypothetical protein